MPPREEELANDLIHPKAAKESIDILGRIYVELGCQPRVKLGGHGSVAISYLMPDTDTNRWNDDFSEADTRERWETLVLNWRTGAIHGVSFCPVALIASAH